MNDRLYSDPQAMRQAITDRLRRRQREIPGSQLSDLQRQFAYDRLLSRLFTVQRERWVLKGATALLARLGGRARHSLDIDLYSNTGDLDEAEGALNEAAGVDLGDQFRFTLRPGRAMLQGANARRIRVDAYLGANLFASFHVDLVTSVELRGRPEEVPPLVPIDLPGIVRPTYLAWPMVDHIADKVCAFIERHPRQDAIDVASTRYRDLADLALLARNVSIEAGRLGAALGSETKRRGLRLPDRFPDPEGEGWTVGYARIARDTADLREKDLAAALSTVRRFIDPILSSTAVGSWEPDSLRWVNRPNGGEASATG